MSRIESAFTKRKENGQKALVTFITAGDPDLEATRQLVLEMEKQGADIVELGIPYSDPIAEGPVIQRANERALKNSIKLRNIFDLVSSLRHDTQLPIVFLLYFNCILQYAPERFFAECRLAGVDGVIIPDLPFEEKMEIKNIAESEGVDIISLVSPTSKERVVRIAGDARGFLYCVSSLGVTGMRSSFHTNFDEFFSFINASTKVPTALGFGISTPEQIAQLRGYSDGLIVGSAIVKKVEESSSCEDAVKKVGEFVKSLRTALDC